MPCAKLFLGYLLSNILLSGRIVGFMKEVNRLVSVFCNVLEYAYFSFGQSSLEDSTQPVYCFVEGNRAKIPRDKLRQIRLLTMGDYK